MEPAQPHANSIWHILGASVVGTSHRKIGRGCDDAHAYLQLENGTLLLAVADGAGLAQKSAEGAKCAVQTALQTAKEKLDQQTEPENEATWHTTLGSILQAVHIALKKLTSDEINIDGNAAHDTSAPLLSLREYATTFLFVIVTSQWAAVTQVGDGAVVVQQTNGQLETLTWADRGEYLNETAFVTDARYLKRARYAILPSQGIQGIALFTDGVEMLALDFVTKKPYEPFFTPLFKFTASSASVEAELAAFLDSDRVCKRTDDDKTLVLAVRL